ncbi:MAG: hypothetical protein F6K42_05215 [Leptolyngbya sp. SIO1D8]|nr:hypothetical protein [Leptolyngbya sp. SIO1D8]
MLPTKTTPEMGHRGDRLEDSEIWLASVLAHQLRRISDHCNRGLPIEDFDVALALGEVKQAIEHLQSFIDVRSPQIVSEPANSTQTESPGGYLHPVEGWVSGGWPQ